MSLHVYQGLVTAELIYATYSDFIGYNRYILIEQSTGASNNRRSVWRSACYRKKNGLIFLQSSPPNSFLPSKKTLLGLASDFLYRFSIIFYNILCLYKIFYPSYLWNLPYTKYLVFLTQSISYFCAARASHPNIEQIWRIERDNE